MYNSDLPNRAELPSSKQLLLSTMGAAVVAAVLLVTTILPAEYGIDPTGAGRVLGLTQMGEIKVALAEEAAKDAAAPAAVAAANTPAQLTKSLTPTPNSEALVVAESAGEAETDAPSARSDTAASKASLPVVKPQQTQQTPQTQQTHQRVFTLKPGAAAEIKLAMHKGAKVLYSWSAEGGNVNYDTHGDSATTSYFGYDKGRNVDGVQGELVAAFDGSHGWFWRNRSGKDVTVTLNTEGDYQSIKRVL